MPRANRYFLPGYVCHITHRCHKQEFLLKFSTDRMCWLRWLFEAKKRYGLCVLNYMVTSNHVHLLVRDRGYGEIACSMQLVAGRTAQAYNRRKRRRGAFWEDRYHATIVDTDEHLTRCLLYIDLNMVRAGVVRHPSEWRACGYQEIQCPPKRYGVVDLRSLLDLLGISDLGALQQAHAQWVGQALDAGGAGKREPIWTESLAVGRFEFLTDVQVGLGRKGRRRAVTEDERTWTLGEPPAAYGGNFGGKTSPLSAEKPVF